MSDDRYCPRCGIEWPNFCPLDGQRLSGPWSCSNAQRPAADTEGSPAAATPEGAARRAVPRRRRGPRAAARVEAPRDPSRTLVDAEAVKANIVRDRLREAPAASRTARTVLDQRAVAAPADAKAPAPADTEAPAPADTKAAAPADPKAAPAPAPKKKKRHEFSDTQWFMKGLDPDLLVDPNTGYVEVDEEEYLRDESIPEEERRKFTLRKRGEE